MGTGELAEVIARVKDVLSTLVDGAHGSADDRFGRAFLAGCAAVERVEACADRGDLRAQVDTLAELLRESDAKLEQTQAEHAFYRQEMRKYAAEAKEAQAALLSQQQATDEAMRRAEEARRELADIRSELLLP